MTAYNLADGCIFRNLEMLDLSDVQGSIVADPKKDISWLFEIDTNNDGSVDYYWSTKNVIYNGQAYTYKIDPQTFTGINLSRSNNEFGLHSPNITNFTISNPGNVLSFVTSAANR